MSCHFARRKEPRTGSEEVAVVVVVQFQRILTRSFQRTVSDQDRLSSFFLANDQSGLSHDASSNVLHSFFDRDIRIILTSLIFVRISRKNGSQHHRHYDESQHSHRTGQEEAAKATAR